jgi:hypothetical protein
MAMEHIIPEGWTLAGLIKGGLAIVLLVFVLNVLFESNVRTFIEERGWDKLLSRFLPWFLQKAHLTMRPFSDRRGFWFAFGIVAGAAAIAWFQPQVTQIKIAGANGPIVWNIEDNAKGLGYFLNIMETAGHEMRILGFQAHGKNITDDPIQQLHGYMRSDLTNAQIPIYIQAQEPGETKIAACFPHPWIPTDPAETFGIPAFAEFNIGTFEKPAAEISPTEGVLDGAALSEFKATFVPFTVVIEYEGGRVERRFTREEIEQQFSIFQKTFNKTLNPLSDPYVLRKPSARPVTLPPLHPLIPLATPSKPSNDNTGSVPPKD